MPATDCHLTCRTPDTSHHASIPPRHASHPHRACRTTRLTPHRPPHHTPHASRHAAPRLRLWPEFALLNHSCAPNTVNYVVGGSMVVRAVAPISQGEEVRAG